MVNTEHFKLGSSTLVHIRMWIYFCLRKLIDEDDSFILLIQCPNRPEVISKSLERPDDSPNNQLSFFNKPVFMIRITTMKDH